MSEDFLLNNFLSYFTKEFLKLKIDNENQDQIDITEDLLKLLPDSIKEITNLNTKKKLQENLKIYHKEGTNIVLD